MQETKYPYKYAAKAADYIVALLKPHCVRIHIAGSIRRMKAEVKDIEIVCEPVKKTVAKGMFGDTDHVVVPEFIAAIDTITKEVVKGSATGRLMQIMTNSELCPGIKLDLFMPRPEDYWRQFAIRTGSADYAQHIIAAAWKRKGWCGVKEIGLRKMSECNGKRDSQDKIVYTLKPEVQYPTLPPVWSSELDFFEWLGVPITDPMMREYKNPINIAQ